MCNYSIDNYELKKNMSYVMGSDYDAKVNKFSCIQEDRHFSPARTDLEINFFQYFN